MNIDVRILFLQALDQHQGGIACVRNAKQQLILLSEKPVLVANDGFNQDELD